MNSNTFSKSWNALSDKLRFLLVGGTNTFISYLIFLLLLSLLEQEKYQISLALSWFLSSFISFFMQKTLVFQTTGRWLQEYIKCFFTWAIAYLINAFLLELVVSFLKLSPAIGQIIAVSSTTIFTYILFKYFAFKVGTNNE